MRAVKCVVGPYGTVMDDTECNAATRPTETQVRTCSLFFLSFICLLMFLLRRQYKKETISHIMQTGLNKSALSVQDMKRVENLRRNLLSIR